MDPDVGFCELISQSMQRIERVVSTECATLQAVARSKLSEQSDEEASSDGSSELAELPRTASLTDGLPGSASPSSPSDTSVSRFKNVRMSTFSNAGRKVLPEGKLHRISPESSSDNSTFDSRRISNASSFSNARSKVIPKEEAFGLSGVRENGPRTLAAVPVAEEGISKGPASRVRIASVASMASAVGIDFTERPEFQATAENIGNAKVLSKMSGTHSFSAEDDDSVTQTEESGSAARIAQLCQLRPVHPDSVWGRLWDMLSIVCIMHDFVAMPLEVFYQDGASREPTGVELAISVYWTLNIPVKFCIGFLDSNGSPVTSHAQVALRYAKTWLGFDVTLVFIDLVSIVLDGGDDFRFLLAMRILRILRLARLLELATLFQTWCHLHLRSENLSITFGIVKIIVGMLCVAHLFTCSWYFVGSLDAERAWPKTVNVEHESVFVRYVTAFHWALVQYSGDSSITPQNASERVCACAVQFVAFITSAIVVSDLTTLMTQLQVMGANSKRQIVLLQRYLFDKKVSTRLASRIVDNARLQIEERKRKPPEHTVEMLAQISTPLLMELHYNMHAEFMRLNHFFARYDTANLAGMRAICHQAIKTELASEGDSIYSVGEIMENPCMYFVTDDGRLLYRNADCMRPIETGICVNEPVLWLIGWIQMGTLQAQKSTYLLKLVVTEALKVVKQYRTKHFYPGRYARRFVQEIKQVEFQNVSDISSDYLSLEAVADEVFDLQTPKTTASRAVSMIRKSMRNR
eukprot:TRINITY_DN11328_c0_g1_i1.p1 TRINITY_DN11328_c0_g1~~TRINITY_DN11328_c0_g1_i1.p1  ORF type:complete len:770 (-),score=107.44 TRINITY_DN11328_c0_g1_i1:151-2400(-)